MKKNLTVEYVVRKKLCTSCGVCGDVCPENAIQFHRRKGIIVPIIDKEECINHLGCSKCFNVCTGTGIELRSISKELYSESKNFDYFVSYYLNIYAGYSNTREIRYHSAAGGVLSQFLIYLLKNGLIDGAVITKFKDNEPTNTETIIATTEQEIISGRSSKYCPVSLDGTITKIQSLEGKFVVVGLPCHIHGFRKFEKLNPTFRNKIFGYFAIYCSSTRTFEGTEYILSRYNTNKSKIESFAYRDDGCPGFMKIITETEHIKIPYREYFKKLRSFFKPKRCLYCVDHFGDLADISFGDIQTGKCRKDQIGINSVITRNSQMDKLLLKAKEDKVLTLENIPVSVLKNAQKDMLHHKKRIAALNMRIERKLGSKTPEYDVIFPKRNPISDYILYVAIKIQRQIGKIKSLWFVINLANTQFKHKNRSQLEEKSEGQ